MVRILDDNPIADDWFGDEESGRPHQRIAEAIERRVLSHEGGGSIGLQGDYGSGKSNVVDLLRRRLSTRDDVCFVVFDAWAHEGDPLRRSFLESLINAFLPDSGMGWVDGEYWTKKKEKLAQRHRTNRETKTSYPTRLATALAIATAGLVPIGLGLRSMTLVDVEFVGPIDFWSAGRPRDWAATWTLFCLYAPLLVVLLNFLRVACDWLAGERKKRCMDEKYPKRFRDIFAAEHWSVVSQHGETTVDSDTIESVDPTSIEFESDFSELLTEALKGDRRVVLVIDNLDRLPAEQCLAVWSNLQAFTSTSSLKSLSNQFALVVPFSPTALKSVWNGNESGRSSETMFEKTFRVRFDVPPPVLSDLRGYLTELMQLAEMGLTSRDEQKVLELVDCVRQRRRERMTPRQLKLFVNQLAALRDLWGDKIFSSHLAYAVLHRAPRERLEACLRDKKIIPEKTAADSENRNHKESEEFPPHEVLQICGDDLVSSLAAIHFNMPVDRAIEFLLADQIRVALNDGDSSVINSIHDRHGEAFWTVLTTVMRQLEPSADPTSLSAWTHALAPLGDESKGAAQAETVREYLRRAVEALSAKPWIPLSDETIAGLLSSMKLDPSNEMKDAVLALVTKTLTSSVKDIELAPRLRLAREVFATFGRVDEKPWVVFLNPAEWLDTAALTCVDESGKPFILPTSSCSSELVVTELVDRATQTEGQDEFVTASAIEAGIKLMAVRPKANLTVLVNRLGETFKAAVMEGTVESANLATDCIRRLHLLRLRNIDEARDFLKVEETVKLLVRAVGIEGMDHSADGVLIASLCFAKPQMDPSQFRPITDEVRDDLIAYRKNGDMERSQFVWDAVQEFELVGIVGDFAGGEGNADAGGLMGDLARIATSHDRLAWAIPDWFLKVNALWLKGRLDDEQINEGVRQLEEDQRAIKHLMEQGDVSEKKTRVAARLLLDHGSEQTHDTISDWAAVSLRSLESEKWEEDIREQNGLVRFAADVAMSAAPVAESATFKSAWLAVLPAILKDEVKLDEALAKDVARIVAGLDNSSQVELGKQTLRKHVDFEVGLCDAVVVAVGEQMLMSAHAPDPSKVGSLLSRTIANRSPLGLDWCLRWLGEVNIDRDAVPADARELMTSEAKSAIAESENDSLTEDVQRLVGLFELILVDEPESPSQESENAVHADTEEVATSSEEEALKSPSDAGE